MDLFTRYTRRRGPRPLPSWQFRLWHLFVLVTVICGVCAYVAMYRRLTQPKPFVPSVRIGRFIGGDQVWHEYSCRPSITAWVWFWYSADDKLLIRVGATKDREAYQDDREMKEPLGFSPIRPIPDDVRSVFVDLQKLVAEQVDLDQLTPIDLDRTYESARQRATEPLHRPGIRDVPLPPVIVKALLEIDRTIHDPPPESVQQAPLLPLTPSTSKGT
jgi:hypothetical protein